MFYLSDFYVVTNTPFIGSVAAVSGWPAVIEWKAYNVDDRMFDFYFDSYRQAREPDEMDEVWFYISRPGEGIHQLNHIFNVMHTFLKRLVQSSPDIATVKF